MKSFIGVHPNRDRHTLALAGLLLLIVTPVWPVMPDEVAKLTPDDGAASDTFGFSVALSGDTALVGAARDDDNGNDSGSAYIFQRTRGEWSGMGKMTASDGGASDHFGSSVSLSRRTGVVGAFFDDFGAGSAYVFRLR